MAWEWKLGHSATSPTGQRVEFWQRPGNRYSVAESPAKVVVSGRTVLRGWSCDGKTYAEYARIVREGYVEPPREAHELAASLAKQPVHPKVGE